MVVVEDDARAHLVPPDDFGHRLGPSCACGVMVGVLSPDTPVWVHRER